MVELILPIEHQRSCGKWEVGVVSGSHSGMSREVKWVVSVGLRFRAEKAV